METQSQTVMLALLADQAPSRRYWYEPGPLLSVVEGSLLSRKTGLRWGEQLGRNMALRWTCLGATNTVQGIRLRILDREEPLCARV